MLGRRAICFSIKYRHSDTLVAATASYIVLHDDVIVKWLEFKATLWDLEIGQMSEAIIDKVMLAQADKNECISPKVKSLFSRYKTCKAVRSICKPSHCLGTGYVNFGRMSVCYRCVQYEVSAIKIQKQWRRSCYRTWITLLSSRMRKFGADDEAMGTGLPAVARSIIFIRTWLLPMRRIRQVNGRDCSVFISWKSTFWGVYECRWPMLANRTEAWLITED